MLATEPLLHQQGAFAMQQFCLASCSASFGCGLRSCSKNSGCVKHPKASPKLSQQKKEQSTNICRSNVQVGTNMYLKVLAEILYSKQSRISLLCLGSSSTLDLFSTLGNNALQRCKGRLGQIQPWVYISVPRAVKSSQIHFKSSNWLAPTLLGQNVFFGVRSRECKDPGVEASPKYPNMF